jgi:hypothetical protein
MKKLLFLTITCLMMALTSCDKDNKENTQEYNGKITGQDLRKCMCCGGFYVDINDSTYRFDSIPANSGINQLTDTFPIYVFVVFHKKDPQCLGDEIIIDKMRKK